MFAHPIPYHGYLDDRILQMSSEFFERFRVDVVSSILYSDVPWGTKSENKVSSDLCVVKTNKGENSDKVAVPMAETDINTDAIHVL